MYSETISIYTQAEDYAILILLDSYIDKCSAEVRNKAMEISDNIVISTFFSLLGVVCLAANGLVCYLLGTQRATKSTFKYYVLSLAVTDILVGIALIPAYLALKWITYTEHWNVRLQMIIKICLISMEIFNAVCSTLHLCLIAFDRLLAITAPIFYRSRFRKRRIVLRLLIFLWFLSLLLALLPFILKKILYIIILQAMVFISNVFIIACYSFLLHRIHKRNRRSFYKNARTKEKQIIKTSLTIMIVFTICWMPSIVLLILYTTNTPYPKALGIAVKFLQYFNSICNPFIYAIFNPKFKSDARNLMANCCGSMKCRFEAEMEAVKNDSTNEEEIRTDV